MRRVVHGLGTAAVVIAAVLPLTARAADAAAGEQKAQVCVACHGPQGVSTNPAVPSLAGQPAQFISTQLLMFREGRRKNEQMAPFAANLTNTDLNNLAAYFSAQKLPAPAASADEATAAGGARLTGQLVCTQCHGPKLLGQQHIPRLAGQQRDYLKAQLRGFKAQTRFDMDGQMTSAAQPLTDADIEVLGNYLATLN